MWASEQLLYLLAKRAANIELFCSTEMKTAVVCQDNYDCFRSKRIDHVLEAGMRYGVTIKDKTVLDLGCNDGALSVEYLKAGASRVIGVDVDRKAIDRAQQCHAAANVAFYVNTNDHIPLENNSVDTIVSHDVFEHISRPDLVLDECYRVLRPEGKLLIGTWGWYHPFAPHLFSIMPVPWVQVFFSEKTIMRTCRRIYHSSWYVPTMNDLDDKGQKRTDKFLEDKISEEHLNKLLIRDFERFFRKSKFSNYTLTPLPFGSRYARWTRMFLSAPFLREFITAYFWAVLRK